VHQPPHDTTGSTRSTRSTGATGAPRSTRTTPPLDRLTRHRGTLLRAGAGALALVGVTAAVNGLTGIGESPSDAAAAISAPAAAAGLAPVDLADPAPGAHEARLASRARALQFTRDTAKAQAKAAADRAAAQKAAAARAAAAKAAAAKAAQQAAQAARARAAQQQQAEASRSSSRDPRSIARAMVAARGWSGQFGCLDSLWQRESGWNYQASNPSSGAYGIPQALPGGKMASAGSDWRTNPATQISWGLGYIASVYGSPCSAWAHSQATGWY
jgi:hypothetical protein